MAPTNSEISAKFSMPALSAPPACVPASTAARISPMLNVRNIDHSTITPMIKPTSPSLDVRNALIAALEFSCSSHQNPMSRKEQTPTSSQPISTIIMLLDMTSSSIDAVNTDSNEKKYVYRGSPCM